MALSEHAGHKSAKPRHEYAGHEICVRFHPGRLDPAWTASLPSQCHTPYSVRRQLAGLLLLGTRSTFSPCDGVVIAAEDGWPENAKTNLRTDLSRAHNIARHFDPGKDDIRSVAGNYVIIRASEHVYAALCHLQTDSVDVSVGQHLTQGDVLGRVGHSGNSLGPHLHFQLMDSYNMAEAKGIPCAFTEYEIFQDGRWNKVHDGIPTSRDRIRF